MKKNSILLTILVTCIASSSFTQDIMTTRNGDEIKVKILEVLPDLVKYKKWDNQDGPTYSEFKANVFMIKYQNGTKDVFNQQTITQTQIQNQTETPQISNDEMKKNEAVKIVENFFFTGFKTASVKTFNMISFRKVNGVMRNYLGQTVYQIDYELTLQFLNDAWMKGNAAEGYWHNDFKTYSTKPDLYASGQQYMYSVKFFPRGTTYLIGGSAYVENTDNGYKIKKYEIGSARDLGIKPIQYGYTSTPSENGSNKQIAQNIVNKTVDYKSFTGFLILQESNFVIKIANVEVVDKLNNVSEVQEQILKSFQKMRRLEAQNIPNKTSPFDTLELVSTVIFSYRNYSANGNSTFFADCDLRLEFRNTKDNSTAFKNNYKLTNYALLSKGFPSNIDANKNLLSSNQFNQALSQFMIGNFPLTGEIIEVTEKNRKQDEAKIVKINLGRRNGLFTGYNFIILDINNNINKPDIVVTEVFEEYSLCKVQQNEKQILEALVAQKKLKVKTVYKP